jgi:E3 ubiquitin-protein ligase UBR7
LVELFGKRNFVCDCGTTRIPETTPCTLRINSTTGLKGDVTGEEPAEGNRYNQNFRNRFCGCGEEYDPHQEKGTMFQCLGLGYAEDGGCGEDWWHPECLVGLSRENYKKKVEEQRKAMTEAKLAARQAPNGSGTEIDDNTEGQDTPKYTITVDAPGADGNDVAAEPEEQDGDDEDPLPPGFPAEDDFDHFICYKCVESNPWIKRYANTEGFLPPVYNDAGLQTKSDEKPTTSTTEAPNGDSKKRKADDTDPDDVPSLLSVAPPKRQKSEDPTTTLSSIPETTTLPNAPQKEDLTSCKLNNLPPTPSSLTPFSLFLKPDFREHLCHCPTHYPLLKPFPQLLEEEETYEPPVSEDGDNDQPGSVGTGSIYDKGEAAFSNMDRVQAIQGAMAYAHLKDGLKAFFQPFAESGKAVGAEDIKAYFERLRGDEVGAVSGARAEEGQDGDGDNRREQSGF